MKKTKYFNRELSWLSFNYRVLQEAKDKSVPLYERIKFLAIYSSNLDEFFRVRVASLRSLLDLKEKSSKDLPFDPVILLKKIKTTVNSHQEEFGNIFKNEILPALADENIFLINEANLNDTQKQFISDYFDDNLASVIQPILLDKNNINTFLKNKSIYFAVRLFHKKSKASENENKSTRYKYAIVEIPADKLGRFITLPENDNKKYVIILDDIIRVNLKKLFPGYVIDSCYAIKLTRDAELYIDDEFTGDLLQKIKKGLSKRKTGAPSRFLYDSEMPKEFLKVLKESLRLKKDDLMAGGKYHNFNDFFSFPNFVKHNLKYSSLDPLPNKVLESGKLIFDVVSVRDVLLGFPYQSYNYVLRFLKEAANDIDVKSIKITLYRVTNNSEIIKELIAAANNGKKVEAFIEVKARFDEELNFTSAEQLQKAGVKVYYSFPKLKVHSKLCLIERNENNENAFYSYIATGNFNENTAKIYTDLAVITKDHQIADDINNVFKILSRKSEEEEFNQLLVAPFNLRKKIYRLIDNEIAFAAAGKKAVIILKLNSLEDWKMIDKLYEASNAGVKIYLIIRGICCLIPGIDGLSTNIKVISIVDRYLEHARIYVFRNDGDKKYFIASADFMRRNLNRRIEAALPINDEKIKSYLQSYIDLQLKDNVKARVINKTQSNQFVRGKKSSNSVRSQYAIYDYFKNNF
jgi:polyphosphate kinase